MLCLPPESFGKKQLMREGGGEVEQRVLAGSGDFSTIAYLSSQITKMTKME